MHQAPATSPRRPLEQRTDLPATAAQRGLRAREVAAVACLWLGLAVVIALLQLGRRTPTNFADEFIYGRLAINVADGEGMTIQGLPSAFHTIYPYLIAPAWKLLSGTAAYRAALLINAVAMTFTVVPAYVLARAVAPRRWALATAACVGVIPAMVWAGMLMTEALAFPLTGLTLLATYQALRNPGVRWALVAAVACLAATAVRTQLVVLFGVLALAVVLDVARLRGHGAGERARRHRWALLAIVAGAVGGAIGIAVVQPEALFGKDACVVVDPPTVGEVLRPASQYLGVLIVSSLMVPAIAFCALAARARNWRDAAVGPLLCVAAAAVVGLVGEAAWFAVTTAPELQDRYVFYAAPVMLACVAALPGRASLRALIIATGGVVVFLAIAFPGFGDVTGGRIAQSLHLPGPAADVLSASDSLPWAVAALVLGALAVVALLPGHRHIALLLVPMLLFGFATFAARQLDANRQSSALLAKYGQPPTYIDAESDGPAAIIAGRGTKPEVLWHLQLWNRKLERTWRVAIPDSFGVGQLCPLKAQTNGDLTPPVPCAGAGLASNLLIAPTKNKVTLQGGVSRPAPAGSPPLIAYRPGETPRVSATQAAGLSAPIAPPSPKRSVERCNRS